MLAFAREPIQQGTRQNVPYCSSTNQSASSAQLSTIENNGWRVRLKFHPSIGWSALIAHADCKLLCRGVFLFTNGPLCTLAEVTSICGYERFEQLRFETHWHVWPHWKSAGQGQLRVRWASHESHHQNQGLSMVAFWFQSLLQMIVQRLNYTHCHALLVWRMRIIQWFNYPGRVVLSLSIFVFPPI